MNEQLLIESAFAALKHAYAPYSRFKVGAALLTKNNKIYTGVNIENASYPLGICAERVAIFKAISEGIKSIDIVAIAIVTNSKALTYPCGACRQVFVELLPLSAKIILSNKETIKRTTVKALMPYAFSKEDLKK